MSRLVVMRDADDGDKSEVIIGDGDGAVIVRVVFAQNGRARLLIEAPVDVRVDRMEIRRDKDKRGTIK